MLKIIVAGAAGRMGKTNTKVITDADDAVVIGAVEMKGANVIGKDAGEIAGVGNINVNIGDDIKQIDGAAADAIIDFSSLQALSTNIDYAVENNIAMVCGTTGVGDKEMEIIKKAGQSIAIIWAPNFSVGINLLAKLTRLTARVLDTDFDVEIIEAHHRMKKDAPSGTAKQLLRAVKEEFNTADIVYGREGMVGQRPPRQIGVHAIRGGDIVGEHTVLFAGIGERIELTHKASTRETFSMGALRAARYLMKQKPGVYTMTDVLGLE